MFKSTASTIALALTLVAALGAPVPARADEGLAGAARSFGRAVRDAGKAVGQGAKHVGRETKGPAREVGHGFRDGAVAAGHGFRDGFGKGGGSGAKDSGKGAAEPKASRHGSSASAQVKAAPAAKAPPRPTARVVSPPASK